MGQNILIFRAKARNLNKIISDELYLFFFYIFCMKCDNNHAVKEVLKTVRIRVNRVASSSNLCLVLGVF